MCSNLVCKRITSFGVNCCIPFAIVLILRCYLFIWGPVCIRVSRTKILFVVWSNFSVQSDN